MTGARGGKSDGSKQQDNGPALFPRLHVAETKRAGPRGPPRNKMALYEQLTIPSHKFNPSPMPLPSTGRTMKSPAMTTPLFLSIPQVPGVSHDSMYSYVPMSYMNPTMMSALTCIPSYSCSGPLSAEATSSMNTSGNKSTVIDGAVESPSVGGAVPYALSHLKYHTTTKKGRGDDDFAVPTYSSATQSSWQTSRPSSPLDIQKASRGQRALLRVKEPVNQKRSPVTKDKSMEVSSLEHNRWSNASGECVTVSVDMDSQETDHRELERVPSLDRYPATAPSTDRVRRADSLTALSEQDMLSNVSSENQSGEGSERSQQRSGSSVEMGSSVLENAPAGSVKFQDVVHAFGQQEFWKTQMIMIRQQRIFSRQVFELHRVIQVQQLLAKTLCTSSSIDEALEKEKDKVHMAESLIAEVPEVPQAERPVAEVPEVPQAERTVAEIPEVPQAESLVAEVPEVPQAESPVAEVPEVPQAESLVAEVHEVPQAESSVAEVPEVPLITEAPQVPEIPERRPETMASTENSRPSLDSLCRPVYPVPVPTQQVFNSEAPWQAPPYGTNPWAVRMASPFMYVPYPGPYPAGYGTYPMMMPMYAQPGALQQQPAQFPTWQQQPVQFPTWQQPGMPHLLSAQDSSAMAAWYCQHIVPAVAPAASASIAPHACHFEHLASSGSNESTACPAGQDGERSDGVVNPNKGSSGETRREGRWVRGDRSLVHMKASDGADLRGNEAECQNGDNTALGGSDPDRGRVQQTNDVVEPEANLEGPQSLKHMRTETGFEAGACRWFPFLSPAKRPIHQSGVIKVVPRALSATPELAANILMSIQTDPRR